MTRSRRCAATSRKRDLQRLFLPENFKPVGATREEETGRAGTRVVYDSYGIPHIYGKTRADMAYGAGWVTARDRGLLLSLGRGPARVAVADVPGVDAFGLITSGQSFVPSPETEALVTRQRRLLPKVHGAKGRQVLADARAYAEGATAYSAANDPSPTRYTVNDVIAATAFIGSIFGGGGGGRGSERAAAGRPAHRAGAGAGPEGVGGRDARRRPGGAHHGRPALSLRPADRRRAAGVALARPGLAAGDRPAGRVRRPRRGRRR